MKNPCIASKPPFFLAFSTFFYCKNTPILPYPARLFFHISLSAAQTARKSLIKQQQFVKNQTTQYFDLFFN